MRGDGDRNGRAPAVSFTPEWISRIVLFGSLAAFIGAVYSAIVLGGGALLGVETPSTPLSVIAMIVVALTFGRARVGAQRLADRIAHGERATPYEVLTGLSELVARSYRHEDVLPRIAELVAAGTGAARVEVWLRVEGDLLLGAAWPATVARVRRVALPPVGLPEIPGAERTVPVTDGEVLLGAIAVAKGAGERLTMGETKLLEDVGAPAGLLLRNVGLTAELSARLDEISVMATELRASRRRIVETQDQERRRLERDIHDGAQQHLVALAVKLRMARTMAEKDPDRAQTLIGEVHGLTDSALENLRDLTRGIYPPALVEHGVAAALREHVRRAGAPVTITTKGSGRPAAAAEAAVYFTCLEAIQNAAKHAKAKRIAVHLERSRGSFGFTVTDDGAGFDPAGVALGSGLQNMQDRLAVVGGRFDIRSTPGAGTEIRGVIPLGSGVPAR